MVELFCMNYESACVHALLISLAISNEYLNENIEKLSKILG